MENLLIETLKVQTESYSNEKMLRYIKKHVDGVKGATWEQDFSGNLYVTKGKLKDGEMYACIVAHTDTVHAMVPNQNFKIYQDKNMLFSVDTRDYNRTGIGGDDKVGVYLALRMLLEEKVLKCAFFVDEEVGCLGSSKANMSFFEDVNLCMQGDRKGRGEITSDINGTEMYGEKFGNDIAHIIEKHNFFEVSGGLTDVKTLAEKARRIPMFNLACGYYQPHTRNEYVNVLEVEETYLFMRDVMEFCKGKNYGLDWEREKSRIYTYDWNNEYWGRSWNHIQKPIKKKKDKSRKNVYRVWSEERKKWVFSQHAAKEDLKCDSCGSEDFSYSSQSDDAWCLSCAKYHTVIRDKNFDL